MDIPPQTLTARITGVYVTRTRETLVSTPLAELQADLEGIHGDVHYGFTKPAGARERSYPRGAAVRNNRQVSLVALDELDAVAAALDVPEIRPEWLGANLALEGLPRLTRLPPFTRIHFPGGAALLVSGENQPCIYPGQVIQAQYPEREGLAQAFVRQALGRRGIVATVEHAGTLRAGDEVRVVVPRQIGYPAQAAAN